jgi:drug/metabolite transporter (DMT)-like permease
VNQAAARLDGFATAVLLFCCVLWGVNQVAIKLSLAGLSPIVSAGLRSLVAAVLLVGWCAVRREPLFVRDGSGRYGLTIGLLFALEFALMYVGLFFTTASRGILFIYAAPFFIALGAHYLVPGERLTATRAAGLVLAFLGLCLGFADALHLPNRRALIGDALEVAAGVVWGATTVVVKMRSDLRVTPQRTLFYQLAISGVALAIAGFLIEPHPIGPLTPTVVVAFLYQAVVVAFATYLVWFWLLAHYPASSIASFSFWTPLFGVMSGALILGDRVTGYLGAAVVLVAAGIYLVNREP